ncbi:MAG: molybdate ABC transporter substrate-binding protein [Puniceicoccales bacterium]|jgi:molybdate transport system substrate-binding protein|nr:molybdate ABC transporter substrate-binding protein [Puniceicoccales bacterium]
MFPLNALKNSLAKLSAAAALVAGAHIAGAFAAPRAAADEILVFAAASLSNALRELAPAHKTATGDTAKFNFASSGALSRQIKEGAPADVIFSADELRVDQLENAGLLAPATRKTLLGNALVIVVHKDGGAAITKPADLLGRGVRRVGIGEPATVPAGTYTKEYLTSLKLWDGVAAKSVWLDNVRSVLAAVEAGNADAGFVYKTDALISKKVKIAYDVPLAEGPKITYPAAVVKASKSPDAARRYLAFLESPAAKTVFRKHGFAPVEAKGDKKTAK